MSEKKLRAWLEKVQYHIEDYDLAMEVRAALAEPVVAYRKHDAETCCCADCCLLRQAREERDEARAEIERLNEAGAWMDEVVRKAACAVAFKRGAEAMREAAARCATERSRYWTETSHAEGGVTTMEDRAEEARYIAEDIRDLPALDDK